MDAPQPEEKTVSSKRPAARTIEVAAELLNSAKRLATKIRSIFKPTLPISDSLNMIGPLNKEITKTIDINTLYNFRLWASNDSPLHPNHKVLENIDVLLSEFPGYKKTQHGKFEFHSLPEHSEKIALLLAEAQEMEKLIGLDKNFESIQDPFSITLIPDARFMKNPVANGTNMLLNITSPTFLEDFRHEFVHVYLNQKFGRTYSTGAGEGAAMLFARLRNPKDTSNQHEKYYEYPLILDGISRTDSTFSHTGALEKVNVDLNSVSPERRYLYAYPWGSLFAQFCVDTYGEEQGKRLFLSFYEQTCLLKNAGYRERETNFNALRAATAMKDTYGKEFSAAPGIQLQFEKYAKELRQNKN